MAKVTVPFTDGKFSVYFAVSEGERSYLIACCDDADLALGVALNLHQLSNSPHIITVVEPSMAELASLRRLDFVKLKLQSNGR